MAKNRDDAPQPTAPPTQKPAGADFKSLVSDALSQIVTTGPEGQQVQGAPSGPVQSAPLPVQQPNQHVSHPQMVPPRPVIQPPVDHSIIAHRDMLRQEEERLAQRQDNRPPAPMPQAMNQVYGVPRNAVVEGGKIRYKAGADKLLIECYETLSRAVSGGLIAPYGTFYRDVCRLVQDLGTQVVDVSPPAEPKTEQSK